MYCTQCGCRMDRQAAICQACTQASANTHTTDNRNNATNAGNTLVYAGFWCRFTAMMLDYLLLSAALFIPFTFMLGAPSALSTIFGVEIGKENIDNVWKDSIGSGITIIAAAIYSTIMESGERSATYGKQLMGIKVLNTKGERISRRTAFARWISQIVSWITLGIGYLIQPFTPRKRALHDLIAGTMVIESTKDRLVQNIIIGVVIALILGYCGIITLFSIQPS